VKKRYRNRNRSNIGMYGTVVGAALASALVLPTVGWTQSVDATLRGQAPAGSVITAKNAATGAVRHTTADANGTYTLVGLPPGTYRVDAGPGTETDVTLTVASTATLDLVATSTAPDETLEEVIVKATRLVEVKTSEVGVTVSQEEIETVPQATRNFLEFADLVPGMQFTIAPNGNTSLTSGAQASDQTNVYIDGVGQKAYVMQGGVPGQNESQGNPFPQLAIGEYKVITSNYKAEYDQISSAAIVAETKSGTNEFHGEIFGDYTNESFRAEEPAEEIAGKKVDSNTAEYGFAFGGPIIQDKLHFFVTYEGKDYNTPIAVIPNVAGINADLPASVVAQFGPADLPFKEKLYFGKLDFEPTDADRFELSGKYRREDSSNVQVGPGDTASAGLDDIIYDKRIDLRWQHSFEHAFNDLLLTYEDAFYNPSPQEYGNGSTYDYLVTNGTPPNVTYQNQFIVNAGPASPLSSQDKGQKGPGIQDDLTFNDLEWDGEHTLKTGVKFKQVKLTAEDSADVNPDFFYEVTSAGTNPIPYQAQFADPVPGENPIASSVDNQIGVYFQDDWALNKKLTLNLGLRWDYEYNGEWLNYVTPAASVNRLTQQLEPGGNPGETYAEALAAGGININDYISNGHNRKPYLGEWQPRLGFSYDLFEDQKHVVFGGIGRAYDRDLFNFLQVEETKSALPTPTLCFTGQPSTCNGAGTAWSSSFYTPGALQSYYNSVYGNAANAGEIDVINNNLKVPYSDQFSVGIRNKLGDWNTSLSVARILSYNGFVWTLGNRYPNGAFWMNGGQPWGEGIPTTTGAGTGSNLILGSNGIATKDTEILLSAEKPYTVESKWGASIAYTYANASTNQGNGPYSFDEANIRAYPFVQSNQQPHHRLVAAGSLHGPWDTIIGAKLTVATPIANDGFMYGLTPVAAVGNPHGYTPIGGYPPETIGYKDLDLQATKSFNIYKSVSAYIRLDFLNVFNWANFANENTTYPTFQPVTYAMNGPVDGTPREIKLTAGAKF
jgi:outer membrane receptor for ferrienterochelin and colicin